MATESTQTATQRAAAEFADAFEYDTRDNGERFAKRKDDAAQWIADAVQAAHGDMFPDDFVYTTCDRVASRISETLEYDADSDIEDSRSEIVDGLVDVYTTNLTAWLASHLARVGYCDEVAEEYGADAPADMCKRLALGQYFEIEQIFGAVWSAVEARAAEIIDDE